MDMARLSSAVQRPGIDPRVWVSYAVADGESHVDMDPDNGGVYVDVICLPTMERYTARVGSEYAGNGFGMYAKIHKDDEIMVSAPSGDPAEGVVVTRRMHSAADMPAQAFADNSDDFIIVVEKDKNLRLTVQGGGAVFISTGGGDVTVDTAGGSVILGESSAGPLDGVVHGSGIDPFTGANYTALQNTSNVVKAAKGV